MEALTGFAVLSLLSSLLLSLLPETRLKSTVHLVASLLLLLSWLTALQTRALEKINRAGGIARRVESVDDVKDIIAQADREAREECHHVVS